MRSSQLATIAFIAILGASPSNAFDPLNLFGHSSTCDQACCDTACDAAGCPPRKCRECYVSVFGGWSDLNDYSGMPIVTPPPPSPPQINASYNDGWIIGGAVGLQLTDHIRAESEYAFRDVTGDTWFLNGSPGSYSGHHGVFSIMKNLLWDFENSTALTPYLGGGIGIAFVDAELTTPSSTIAIDDAAFAYQAIAGASAEVKPGVDVFAEYRFFGYDDVTVRSVSTNEPFLDGGFDHDSIVFGVRIAR
ncbi:MAG: outer membrane beta-barrel protein [Planctomycetota bacterium]